MTDLSKYRRYYGTTERLKKLLAAGRCPACEMKLESKYHAPCPYLDDLANEVVPTDDLQES